MLPNREEAGSNDTYQTTRAASLQFTCYKLDGTRYFAIGSGLACVVIVIIYRNLISFTSPLSTIWSLIAVAHHLGVKQFDLTSKLKP
jgi:hypothetical protein